MILRLFLLLTLLRIGIAQQQKLVCYFTNWSQYRQIKFFPENIDPDLCTHIIYAFAKLSNDKLDFYEWNEETTSWSKGLYERMMDLKKKNPNLKILLAVGGWNMGPGPFSSLVHDDNKMKSFVVTTIEFLKKHKFDGLDLDWEYPASRDGSKVTDKEKLSQLLKLLRAGFDSNNFLLTAAVAAGYDNIKRGYEISEMAKYLDFINVMSYDYHGSWDNVIGHNAPMFARNDEIDNEAKLNVDWTVNYWLENGTPKEKLIMGVPTYGRGFTLSSSTKNKMGEKASGAGSAGEYTREAGFLSYYEICKRLQGGWTQVYNEEQKIKYAHSNSQWIGYDDIDTIRIKTQYVKIRELGGVMVWSLDLDDFDGSFCNQGKYPLIKTIRKELFGDTLPTPEPVVPTTITESSGTSAGGSIRPVSKTSTRRTSTTSFTTKSSTTTTTSKTSMSTSKALKLTSKSSSTITTKKAKATVADIKKRCLHGDGYYADLESRCSKYYLCISTSTDSPKLQEYVCPSGLLFDVKIKSCNFNSKIECNNIGGGFDQLIDINTSNALTISTLTASQVDTRKLCYKGNGFYADYDSNCDKYYFCVFVNTPNEKVFNYTCPPELKFNLDTKLCERNYVCAKNPASKEGFLFNPNQLENDQPINEYSNGRLNLPASDKQAMIDRICINGDGIYADRGRKCQYYYECIFVNTEHAQVFERHCHENTAYDEKLNICNWQKEVSC